MQTSIHNLGTMPTSSRHHRKKIVFSVQKLKIFIPKINFFTFFSTFPFKSSLFPTSKPQLQAVWDRKDPLFASKSHLTIGTTFCENQMYLYLSLQCSKPFKKLSKCSTSCFPLGVRIECTPPLHSFRMYPPSTFF